MEKTYKAFNWNSWGVTDWLKEETKQSSLIVMSFNPHFFYIIITQIWRRWQWGYVRIWLKLCTHFIKCICVCTYAHICICICMCVYNLETLPPETWTCHGYQSRAENLVHLGSSHFPTSRKKCTFAILHRWSLLDYDFCPSVLFTG